MNTGEVIVLVYVGGLVLDLLATFWHMQFDPDTAPNGTCLIWPIMWIVWLIKGFAQMGRELMRDSVFRVRKM